VSPVWRWRVAFLGLTALVVGMEFFAWLDGSDDTDTWTHMIVRWVPGEVFALAFSGLVGWLVVHFGLRYWRKRQTTQGESSE
jgi:hypothetical protein